MKTSATPDRLGRSSCQVRNFNQAERLSWPRSAPEAASTGAVGVCHSHTGSTMSCESDTQNTCTMLLRGCWADKEGTRHACTRRQGSRGRVCQAPRARREPTRTGRLGWRCPARRPGKRQAPMSAKHTLGHCSTKLSSYKMSDWCVALCDSSKSSACCMEVATRCQSIVDDSDPTSQD